MSTEWNALVESYAKAPVEAPGLKVVTLAQWALESGFGASDLARKHRNFAGLKFRARVNAGREDRPLARPVDYQAHDGLDTYCAFDSLENFIHGYWAFVDNGPMYEGWRDFADDPAGYVAHLKRGGYAADPDYVRKVLSLLPRIRTAFENAGHDDVVAAEPGRPFEPFRLAVLVGHNSRRRGAFSQAMQVAEWVYNQRVARQMKRLESEYGIETRTFLREDHPAGYGSEIAQAYAAMDAWKPAAIMELHFNAGGGAGTEVLYWGRSAAGRRLADAVREAVVVELGLRDRGSKGRKAGERGGTSLQASRFPTILTEPFFGDSEEDCARMLELGEASLARAYLIGARDAFAGLEDEKPAAVA